MLENSIGIALTETWLSEDIKDAEITIENFDIFRADRVNRSRGGAALYLRSDLNCKMVNNFSNSVVETVIVKCKKLDMIFISVYRPPNTKVCEWNQAVDFIISTVELSQSHGEYNRIMMAGDFNFPSLIWNDSLPKIELKLNPQQERFVMMLSELCLLNMVDFPTHKDNNILDLILTNDSDFVISVWPDENIKFSDHKFVNCMIDVIREDKCDKCDEEMIKYITKVPQFSWRNGTEEQWVKYKDILNENDWNALSMDCSVEQKVNSLYQIIENAVSLSFDNLIEKKKGKKRIPKEIKNLFRKKNILSKRYLKRKIKIN